MGSGVWSILSAGISMTYLKFGDDHVQLAQNIVISNDVFVTGSDIAWSAGIGGDIVQGVVVYL